MDRIVKPADERSPLVEFDFPNHRLLMEGESYPEDAAAFFGPLLEALDGYLQQLTDQEVVFDLKLTYFNSSSAKALMNMFQRIEQAAAGGAHITLNWHYHSDDDTMQEFGEEFSEDFQAAAFRMLVIEP